MGEHLSRADSRGTKATSATEADPAVRPRPLLVELLGPAGAGKTAVLRALGMADRGWRAGFRVERGASVIPWVVRSGVALAPMLGSLLRRAPRMLAQNSIALMRLKILEFALHPALGDGHRALLLDEGPLFLLARLRVHGGTARAIEAFSTFWYQTRQHWRTTIDAVVWLDAEDECLMQRIRARRKRHRVKDANDRQMRRFLDQYRTAYREVLASSGSHSALPVLAHDTTRLPLDEVANRVRVQLRGFLGGAPDGAGEAA